MAKKVSQLSTDFWLYNYIALIITIETTFNCSINLLISIKVLITLKKLVPSRLIINIDKKNYSKIINV